MTPYQKCKQFAEKKRGQVAFKAWRADNGTWTASLYLEPSGYILGMVSGFTRIHACTVLWRLICALYPRDVALVEGKEEAT